MAKAPAKKSTTHHLPLTDKEIAWCDCYGRVLASLLPTGRMQAHDARIVAAQEATLMLQAVKEEKV